ncbi:MAG: dihydrolipoyl dehydrogenase [Chitinispirillaceae bacterium]|nr:dihydrolipoyl dehydrogenase [Chitinispirillaceae bacterium]
MQRAFDFDVAILGSGPGGYVAAIRCSQHNKKTAIIEKDRLGGVCLNIGCIPSKALIHHAALMRAARALEPVGAMLDLSGFDYAKVHAASRRAADKLSRGVAHLLKKNNVSIINGAGCLLSNHELSINGTVTITAEHIIIATGSRPRELDGFAFDETQVLSSNGGLMLEALPKKMIVIGGGAIGVEFTYIMNAFGVEVQLVEIMEELLPGEDREIAGIVRNAFVKRGVSVHTGTRALSLERDRNGLTVLLENKERGRFSLSAEKLLVVVGRTPNTDTIGLEAAGVTLENGSITVGDYYETSVSGIYAIGDVVATPFLAHVASKEGEIAAGHIAGRSDQPKRIDPDAIPSAAYCEPEVASFGLTRAAADKRGIRCAESRFPFRASGKAVAMDDTNGFIKLVHDPEGRTLLGAHCVGPHVTELVHELLLLKTGNLPISAIAEMIHAHPTLSEAVLEVGRMATGQALHL